MNIQDFTNTFLDYITPGCHVLDFGAGEGRFIQMFLKKGSMVTAVDIRPPPHIPGCRAHCKKDED
jgi:2-polyprenyl-3-methyl-5-hydroxy-6-metoxy-1,4-benzoquinol methylase